MGRSAPRRYDELWFSFCDPGSRDNPWVRGASDYLIRLDPYGYFYAEIKIKAVKFKKTEQGGTTRRGSPIARYGCKSFYLDRKPVYENMCEFSRNAGINPGAFLLLFVSEDMEEIHVISLAEIIDLVENGYNGMPICEIQEGYGTNTTEGTAPSYLIPEAATHQITRKNREYLAAHATRRLVLPQKYYACNRWFYHCCRTCRFISGKADRDLSVFYSAAQAAAGGRKACNECFSGQQGAAEDLEWICVSPEEEED